MSGFDFAKWEREQKEAGVQGLKTICDYLGKHGYTGVSIYYCGGHDSGSIDNIQLTKADPPFVSDVDSLADCYGGDIADPMEAEPYFWEQTWDSTTNSYKELEITPAQKEVNEKLWDAAYAIVSAKWYGFAFEGHVSGAIYIDVRKREMRRCDDVEMPVSNPEYSSE